VKTTTLAQNFWSLGLALLSGCGQYSLAPVNPYRATFDEFSMDLGTKRVDVLFVVDSSGSMGSEQATLARSIGSFIQSFSDSRRKIDFHIGVITTDTLMVGHHGVQVRTENGSDIVQVPDGTRTKNLTVKLSDYALFSGPGSLVVRNVGFDGLPINHVDLSGNPVNASNIAAVAKYLHSGMSPALVQSRFKLDAMPGTNGSGYESPLLSIVQFLQADKLAGWNQGFLRADSLFSVVVVTDEDESIGPCDSNSLDGYLRSAECVERERTLALKTDGLTWDNNKLEAARMAYIDVVPAAKAARLDLFRSTFLAVRPQRPKLLSLDTVVAMQRFYPGTSTGCAAGYGINLREVSKELNAGSNNPESKIHDMCVPDFGTSIESIGTVIANSIEDEFNLKEERVDPASIAVEINGQLLMPASFVYNESKNSVKIVDFEVDTSTLTGTMTIRIYYDKRVTLVNQE